MNKPTDRILLIEDNPADVKLARLAFHENAIANEIIHCPTGESLLKLLPDLDHSGIAYLLLDLNMPGICGIELLKILRETEGWKWVPVIVFTTSDHASDVRACYEAGANGYVVKPIEFNDYHRVVRAIHGFWGELNIRA